MLTSLTIWFSCHLFGKIILEINNSLLSS